MHEVYYQNKVYPLQNEFLDLVKSAPVAFYLTGGTALSRFYLNHRYSDALDFFVNQDPKFKRQCNQSVQLIQEKRITLEIGATSDSFLRMFIEKNKIRLKIDFVNDVSFHYGSFEQFAIFDKVDNWRNILSNKICALSRYEPKDVVDILFVAKTYHFEWEEILKEAQEKDLWVEPIEVSKIIREFKPELFNSISWVNPVNVDELTVSLKSLYKDIFYGRANSLRC
jgi:hypothetical protein